MSGIFYNGEILPADKPVLQAGNRAFQYGDGLFETMRICNGRIILGEQHFDRLFSGMQVLMLPTPQNFTPDYLQQAILGLCRENDQLKSARVRLTVFRRATTLNEKPSEQPSVLIESWPLEERYIFNDKPFTIDIFTDARKNADMVSPYKTVARLPYALATVFAQQHRLNDCLVTNHVGNICDSSIANVFVVKDKIVHTPHSEEGAIAGIMSNHIFENIVQAGIELKWAPITIETLLSADEVFLTNMIRGIQPVTHFRKANYSINISRKIFDTLISPLTVC